MSDLETEFIYKTVILVGTLHLLMFGVIAFFLKGIYENTNKMNVSQATTVAKSNSNTKRIDKLDADHLEMNRSLHDFKNDMNGRVGILEFRATERRNDKNI